MHETLNPGIVASSVLSNVSIYPYVDNSYSAYIPIITPKSAPGNNKPNQQFEAVMWFREPQAKPTVGDIYVYIYIYIQGPEKV